MRVAACPAGRWGLCSGRLRADDRNEPEDLLRIVARYLCGRETGEHGTQPLAKRITLFGGQRHLEACNASVYCARLNESVVVLDEAVEPRRGVSHQRAASSIDLDRHIGHCTPTIGGRQVMSSRRRWFMRHSYVARYVAKRRRGCSESFCRTEDSGCSPSKPATTLLPLSIAGNLDQHAGGLRANTRARCAESCHPTVQGSHAAAIAARR